MLITVSVEGLAPLERPSGVELRDGQNMPRLRYTDLSATDAAGKMLRVGMGVEAGAIVLRVAAEDARFRFRSTRCSGCKPRSSRPTMALPTTNSAHRSPSRGASP